MKNKLIAFILATATTLGAMAITNTTAKADSFGGWHKVNGKWHSYMDGDMEKGWIGLGYLGNCTWWYCNEKTGDIVTGWFNDKGNWYYLDPNKGQPGGARVVNWNLINGKWYYFDNLGKMKTGWQLVNGHWYFINSSGEMQTGWKLINNEWYFLNNSGVMETGWKSENGDWYYLNNSGQMAKGWSKVNGQWYFFNASGVMNTGWTNDNGTWYYLKSNGSMTTGWQFINNRWYFMDGSGVMLNNGTLDGWQINHDGTATVTVEKARDILKNTLKNKAKYVEYDHMERGASGEYEYYRLYSSDKERDKSKDSILDFYSVNKFTGRISQG